ncbi:uncharacterized protein LOC131149491 isoform X2 [Malania oleifera]|uniref:uncharacterized protein LOC131149491 isoform X2 n=1 Tax=Malania oleifera TaxID=397392 RepID=UPI0025AE405B|nr:uncharacterized protein LOC131149491 isoform X2 [Malania oleifera]
MASTSSAGIKIIKDDEIDAKHFEKDLMRCSIPKIPSEQIYKREGFKLMPDYSIETYEQTTSLTIEQDTVPLFDEEFFTKHKRKYKFLHVGSVQVMASPLTRLGINNSIIVCLRDGRRSTPRDSLLGLVETSLCQGPIYFHCFPNRTIPLTEYVAN